MAVNCPCCYAKKTKHFKVIEGYDYYQCTGCGSLFLDPDYLLRIDQGDSLVEYREDYWSFEVESSRKRSWGACLARLAEVIHYSKRDIDVFLDIASGTGFILDAVNYYIPGSSDKFYATEKYPPPDIQNRTQSKNYFVGEIDDFPYKVDAGMCIEVVEHLTPSMLREFLSSIASISNENAVYLFNSGMPEFVINENPGYLAPNKVGHIVSYSLDAMRFITKDYGFSVYAIQGKTWAYILEYSKEYNPKENICDRIWSITDHNRNILSDPQTGEVLRILGLESARAYM
jgi:hypothetical protein